MKKIKNLTLLFTGICMLLLSVSCSKSSKEKGEIDDKKDDRYGVATATMKFESGETIAYKGYFIEKPQLIGIGATDEGEDKWEKWRLAGHSVMVKDEKKYIIYFTADIKGAGTYELHATGQANLGSEIFLGVKGKDEGPFSEIEYKPLLFIPPNKEVKGSSTLIISSIDDKQMKGTFSLELYNSDEERVIVTSGKIETAINKQG